MQLRVSIIAAAVTITTATAAADRPITIDVDAREAPRRLLRAHLVVPAQPGKLVLRYPKWIPGEHGPTGPVADISALAITAGGKAVRWTRDPTDMYSISLDVPKGAGEIVADLELVLPANGDFGAGPSASDHLDMLSWNQVLMYPDGRSSDDLRVRASVKVPRGWKLATALSIEKQAADRTEFGEVSLTTLVDSPVMSGEYMKEIVLADSPRVRLVVAADSEAALAVPDEQVKSYRRLVAEANALFGAHHYKAYTFLLALSDRIAAFGLEHHESSNDSGPERAFVDDLMKQRIGFLLSHEYVHSWNGKYRRPAGLAPGRFDVALDTSLLWVYEGLTEYLGVVVGARSGFESPDTVRGMVAVTLGRFETMSGRAWRPLVDTAVAAQLLYGTGSGWASRSRSVDFYPEGLLFWLEVDAKIRARTKGAKSLDDFCKAFYGGKDGAVEVVTYQLDDVVAALDGVVHDDWRALIDQRIYGLRAKQPVEGVEAAGWKLGYGDVLPAALKGSEAINKYTSEAWTIGIIVEEDTTISDVVPGSPADRAGVAPGAKLVAVDGHKFDALHLREAVARTKKRPGLELLLQKGDTYTTFKLELSGGPRYPLLERIKGTDDALSAILAPRTK